MKKIFLSILTVLLILSLSSCITINIPSSLVPEDITGYQTEETAQGTGTPRDDTTAADGPADPDEPEMSLKERIDAFDATIGETLLFDSKGIRLTAKELRYDNNSAYLTVKAENNSGSKLTFVSGSVLDSMNSVNGYMVGGGYVYQTMEAGTEEDLDMRFGLEELITYDIRNIAEIGIGFNIEDENYNSYLQTGPLYIKTSADAGHDYSLDSFERSMRKGVAPSLLDFSVLYSSGDDIASNSFIAVDNLYFIERSGGNGYYLLIEIVNKTNEYLDVCLADVCLNGLRVYNGSWDAHGICGGKRTVMSVSMSELLCKEYMELLKIGSYDSIAMNVYVTRPDSYERISSDDITIALTSKDRFDYPGTVVYSGHGVTIKALGILEDPSEYFDDVHVLLAAKNDNGFAVLINDDENALVNGTEIDSTMSYVKTAPGEWALIDIELEEDALADSGLGLSGIKEVKLSLVIENGDYDTLDEPDITLDFTPMSGQK